MLSIETFNTQRLIGDRLNFQYLDLLYRMHQDPKVMATLGGVRSDEQTRQFLDDNLQHWKHYGFGLWVFRDKEAGEFVGRGGLRNINLDGNNEV